ncbi:hypothetical protein JCM10213_009191 [Rhodosporidiobolus nylandii]
MRSTLSLSVLLVSLSAVSGPGSLAAGQHQDVVRRSSAGERGAGSHLYPRFASPEPQNNLFGQGGNGTNTGNQGVAQQAGTIASNGTVVDQAQVGDAATAAGTGAAAGGQGQANNTAAAANASNAAGNAAQGKPPPANIVDTGDPQKNLFLDPSQIAKGLTLDGQQVPEANQVASATSVNNFINSCLLRTDLVITGSCNAVPMGVIAAQNKAPSSKFTNPKNLDVIPPNQSFTITMAINNLVTGNFVNAQQTPQATDENGIIIGHSHVVVEQIPDLQSTAVTNPQNFEFFKGFNEAAVNGVLSAAVTGGLPEGVYKMSSINSAANHQPALVGVAQHGSLDDAVYFIVSNNPNALATALNLQGGANNASAAAAGGASSATTTSAAAVAGTTSAAASGVTTTPAASSGTTSAAAQQNVGGNQTASAVGGQGAKGGFGGFGKGGRNGNRLPARPGQRFSRVGCSTPPREQKGLEKKSLLERRLEDLVRRELAERDSREAEEE